MKFRKGLTLVSLALLLAGCQGKTSEQNTETGKPSDAPKPTETAGTTDTELPEPEPVEKTLEDALSLDYTNCIIQTTLSYTMGDDIEATTEYFEEYLYNGYTTVNDYSDQGNYLSYHD